MDDERYVAEFGRGVGVMIRALRQVPPWDEAAYAEAPSIKDRYLSCTAYYTPQLERMICRALAARERFRATAPPWAWATELPLDSAEIRKLMWSGDPRRVVVGLFANSLACANWDF